MKEFLTWIDIQISTPKWTWLKFCATVAALSFILAQNLLVGLMIWGIWNTGVFGASHLGFIESFFVAFVSYELRSLVMAIMLAL